MSRHHCYCNCETCCLAVRTRFFLTTHTTHNQLIIIHDNRTNAMRDMMNDEGRGKGKDDSFDLDAMLPDGNDDEKMKTPPKQAVKPLPMASAASSLTTATNRSPAGYRPSGATERVRRRQSLPDQKPMGRRHTFGVVPNLGHLDKSLGMGGGGGGDDSSSSESDDDDSKGG